MKQHTRQLNDRSAISRNIISELCGGQPPLDEEKHFPENDFIDRSTGAQYFLHRHTSAEVGETTHIHIFKRWSSKDLKAVGLDSAITHLAALALDSSGRPDYWFVVNQWVVGDYWLSADETVNLFVDWKFSKAASLKSPRYRHWHEWIAGLVASHLNTSIREVLVERDQILDQMIDEKPGENVLEDRSIEVICRSNQFNRQIGI